MWLEREVGVRLSSLGFIDLVMGAESFEQKGDLILAMIWEY